MHNLLFLYWDHEKYNIKARLVFDHEPISFTSPKSKSYLIFTDVLFKGFFNLMVIWGLMNCCLDEITHDRGNDGNVSTDSTSVSVPINIVTVPIVPVRSTVDRRHGGQHRYDRSSTSSTESDNSVDLSTSRRCVKQK